MAFFCAICSKELPAKTSKKENKIKEILTQFQNHPEVASIFDLQNLKRFCSYECLAIYKDFLTTERPPTNDC